MHAYDHGVAMHIINANVKMIHKLEDDLGIVRNVLMHKLTARMHNMSSSLLSKHTTLMRFTHQSIVTLFETLTTPNKKGQKQQPIVDAGDVQKLMLALPYLLDGLADQEIAEHNARSALVDRVVDPIPSAIMAINEWLHWYHLFRNPEPDDDDIDRLTDMGKALLSTLVRVFPFRVRVGNGGATRSIWSNEKVHSILHAPRTLRRMGRSQNVSCQVTETRHKGVKRKGSRTNRNPGTSGFSLMQAELRDSACQHMANTLDETGACIHLCIYDCISILCIGMSMYVIVSAFNSKSSPTRGRAPMAQAPPY
jgi:hypothetical protein